MSDHDVAIVGYGPTGMTLAALLGQLGHSIVVLERFEGLYNLPRAACFDDETMRLFQKLGLARGVEAGAVVQRDYDWVNADGEVLVKIEYPDRAPGGWPALYMMFQPEIEAVLDRHDKALPGVEIRQGVTVTAMEQDAESVTLRGTDAEGTEMSVRARYVVGADGGSGFVRRELDPGLDDYEFQENWLVCDFRLHRTVPGLPMFRQVCDAAQPRSIVRIGPEHHRFSFMLAPGETVEQATAEDGVWSRVSPHLSRGDATLIRTANYIFRSRVVRRWREGRVFLAGDAAHEMPPFLGQGMCSGLRDAHNLAWKLDAVLGGRAEAALLDTYQAEREPHVRFITEKAIELGRVQTLRDPEKARARDERLLALRRAEMAPEKIRLPGLAAGLVAPGGGAYVPQGRIRRGDEEVRFDDVVGPGWCILAADPAPLADLGARRRAWERFGGHVAVLGMPGGLEEAGSTYADWFAANDCTAVVIRPDWYAYGMARDASGLAALLDQLADTLGAMAQDDWAVHAAISR